MKLDRIELIKCPSCRAYCKLGHDDDFIEFCAKCGDSFCIDFSKVYKMSKNNFDRSNKIKYERHSWEAFEFLGDPEVD